MQPVVREWLMLESNAVRQRIRELKGRLEDLRGYL